MIIYLYALHRQTKPGVEVFPVSQRRMPQWWHYWWPRGLQGVLCSCRVLCASVIPLHAHWIKKRQTDATSRVKKWQLISSINQWSTVRLVHLTMAQVAKIPTVFIRDSQSLNPILNRINPVCMIIFHPLKIHFTLTSGKEPSKIPRESLLQRKICRGHLTRRETTFCVNKQSGPKKCIHTLTWKILLYYRNYCIYTEAKLIWQMSLNFGLFGTLYYTLTLK